MRTHHFNIALISSFIFRISIAAPGADAVKFHDFYLLYQEYEALHTREFLLTWLLSAQHALPLAEREGSIQVLKNANADKIYIIPGEEIRDVIDKARWFIFNGGAGKVKGAHTFGGKVYLTNFRLCLVSAFPLRIDRHSRYNIPAYFDRMSVPLSTISRVQLLDKRSISVSTKDNRALVIQIAPSSDEIYVETVLAVLSKEAFLDAKVESLKSRLFAFRFSYPFHVNGWVFSDILKEYARQGLTDETQWRVSNVYCFSKDIYNYSNIFTINRLWTTPTFRSSRPIPSTLWCLAGWTRRCC